MEVAYVLLAIFIILTLVFLALFVLILMKYITNRKVGAKYNPVDAKSKTIIALLNKLVGEMQSKFCETDLILSAITELTEQDQKNICSMRMPSISFDKVLTKNADILTPEEKKEVCLEPKKLAYILFVNGLIPKEEIVKMENEIDDFPPSQKGLMCENVDNITKLAEIYGKNTTVFTKSIFSLDEAKMICMDVRNFIHILKSKNVVSPDVLTEYNSIMNTIHPLDAKSLCNSPEDYEYILKKAKVRSEIEQFTEPTKDTIKEIYVELCKEGTTLEQFKIILKNMVKSFC